MGLVALIGFNNNTSAYPIVRTPTTQFQYPVVKVRYLLSINATTSLFINP